MGETKDIGKQRLRSQKAIKDAFCELLLEKPFKQITVKEIYERAGYSRTAFYSNYEDKDHLSRELVNDEIDVYVQCIERSASMRLPSDQAMYQTSYSFFKHACNNKNTYMVIIKKMPYSISYFCKHAALKIYNKYPVKYDGGKELDFFQQYLYEISVHCLLSTIGYWLDCGCIYSEETLAKLLTDAFYHETIREYNLPDSK